MANRNGMGPLNEGPVTGRGLGKCPTNEENSTFGRGLGRRCCGNSRPRNGRRNMQVTEKESLENYKEHLQKELERVEKDLTSS